MIEDIVLYKSKRKMDILRNYLDEKFILNAANLIYDIKMKIKIPTVGIVTGFYANGYAETDGPVGAYFLYKALKKLELNPVIVTDKYCRGFFDDANCFFYPKIKKDYSLLISVERCGRSVDGRYYNMKNIDITKYTFPLDDLFINTFIPTIGIGDGGNEIGMGNLYNVIKNKLNIKPSVVCTDHLIISSVSNWGAYGLIAYLERIFKKRLLPNEGEVSLYIKNIVDFNSIDGVSGKRKYTVDGYKEGMEEEIIFNLKNENKIIF